MKNSNYNMNKDLVVVRRGNGIVLLSPHNVAFPSKNFFTLGQLMSLKLNIFFKDVDSKYINLTESLANLLGYSSTEEALRSATRNSTPETPVDVIQSDLHVIQTKMMQIKLFKYTKKNKETFDYLTIKMPWFTKNNKVIGVVGFLIVIDAKNMQNVATSFSEILSTGLINSINPSSILSAMQIGDISFTRREKGILVYLVKGRSAKQIAQKLKISQRTVEEYLANLRKKLNVSSTSELIEKIIPDDDLS